MKEVRIDKWLWATRVFKTRTIATNACKLGRVTIGGMPVKPSHGIKVGDRIDVRKPPVTYTFEVIGLLNNRVGAKSCRISPMTPSSALMTPHRLMTPLTGTRRTIPCGPKRMRTA